jgi:hypothetical protein
MVLLTPRVSPCRWDKCLYFRGKEPMNEEFLYHLWLYRLYDNRSLLTTDGDDLEIQAPGERNSDSGPDFFNARIKIGKTCWAGNVEIHVLSSDWYKHGHHQDTAYDNVILHVVAEDDKPVRTSKGVPVPTLVLKDRIDGGQLYRYRLLKSSVQGIPCRNFIGTLEPLLLISLKERMSMERLEYKSQHVSRVYSQTKGDWDETMFRLLGAAFGLQVNVQPMTQLMNFLSWKLFRRMNAGQMQAEAILFGQAGLLETRYNDEYPRLLQNEFAFYRQKLTLVPMRTDSWKFMRMRPAGFPTFRLSQFAYLISNQADLLYKIKMSKRIEEIRTLLTTHASPYWLDHFHFDQPLKKAASRSMGIDMIDRIILNAVLPFLFLYAKENGDEALRDKVLSHLSELEAEDNTVIRKWRNIGIVPEHAGDSQALLHLSKEYCQKKKCLRCAAGIKILKG